MGDGLSGDHGLCSVFQEGVQAAVHVQSPGGWQEWGSQCTLGLLGAGRRGDFSPHSFLICMAQTNALQEMRSRQKDLYLLAKGGRDGFSQDKCA